MVRQPPSTITYVRDRYGLRGLHAPISAVDLVTVGGSTTDQRFITEGQTWQDVIHELTGIVVANAGVDGMGSQSHTVVLETWLHDIPGLRPKYYLHYLGINEAHLSVERSRAHRSRYISWSRAIYTRSAIVHAVNRMRGWFGGPVLVAHGVLTTDEVVGNGLVPADTDRRQIADFIERAYKPNLRELLEVHRRHGERAILVSQPANPGIVKHQDGKLLVGTEKVTRLAFALDEINATTGEICRENADVCRFIDLAGRVPFEPEDFYDLVHNTPQGARKIGEFLARELAFIKAERR